MKQWIQVVLTLALLLPPLMARGAETRPQLKSETTAWVLGLDPIPGDALAYSGHPGQALINAVIGVPGGFFFYVGMGEWLTGENSDCDDACASGVGGAIMLAGAILYIPALVWDAIGGIHYTKKHNEEVRKRSSSWSDRFQPFSSVHSDGAVAGIQIRF